MSEDGFYRTSAAPSSLESTCLLCGAEGDADSSCRACAVAMPRITCRCGVVNGITAEHCHACMASLHEPRIHARACPRCVSTLTEIGIEPTASVHVCFGCRGLFVPARAWHLLTRRHDLVDALETRLPAAGAPPPADVRLLDCPECSSEMERMRFAATSSVVVDACPRQDGLWVDAGELGAAIRYAKHRREIGPAEAYLEAERANPAPVALIAPPPPKRPFFSESGPGYAIAGVLALVYGSLYAGDCASRARARTTPVTGAASQSRKALE